jgi:hypothetical protein
MIDFWLAMYSHCEHPQQGRTLPSLQKSLLELTMVALLGDIRWSPTRLCTYLQGSVTFLDEDAEFRIHLWFSLSEGHPRFPDADRGLVCWVQPVSPEGLYGPVDAHVAWLGTPLADERPAADPKDWIGVMIQDQGYMSIEGSQWGQALDPAVNSMLMAGLLSRHLDGMVSRRILEQGLAGHS